MNKTLLTLGLVLAFASASFSQSPMHIGKFKVKKLDFSFGFESDYINGLDYDFFLNQMPDQHRENLDQLNFAPTELYSGVCENPSINVGITLELPNRPNIEWRNAFAYKGNRVDAVSYYNNTDYSGNYLSATSTHDEYTLESALVLRGTVVNTFNFYAGLGTNLGMTSPNKTCIFTDLDITADDFNFSNIDEMSRTIESNSEFGEYHACFDTGVQLNQRVFGLLGFGIQLFRRVEVGVDLKYGYGYRADLGSSIDGTNIVGTNFNVRYILK